VEFNPAETNVASLEGAIALLGFDAGDTKSKNPHKCGHKAEGKDCEKKSAGCCAKAKASGCCKEKK
jgi:hypothetical protein